MAGVALAHNKKAPSPAQYTFQRAEPRRTVAAYEHKTLALPHQHQDFNHGSYRASAWLLWDNRYWIRVHDRRDDLATTEIAVRFFTAVDLPALRKSTESWAFKQLRRLLEAAPGNARFQLPVIVVRPDPTQPSHATVPEQVVAFPTLRWSAEGWGQWPSENPRNTKSDELYWEIRFKHIDLALKKGHRVVSRGPQSSDRLKFKKPHGTLSHKTPAGQPHAGSASTWSKKSDGLE
ncbi:hypothetical protein LTR08_001853 [Meristemomyces frigidus]|nr:hypothetical protein LTR08_001853 [Meristemomyces frigidus]